MSRTEQIAGILPAVSLGLAGAWALMAWWLE